MKNGFVHIVCGGTGTGKTSYIQNLIKNKPNVLIYDVNNEYNKNSKLISISDFLLIACNSRNKIIVFEEATIYFNHRNNSEKLTEFLVRKRHFENYNILVFHSLRSIPIHILDFTDYITLFDTSDNIVHISEKFKYMNVPENLQYIQNCNSKQYVLQSENNEFANNIEFWTDKENIKHYSITFKPE